MKRVVLLIGILMSLSITSLASSLDKARILAKEDLVQTKESLDAGKLTCVSDHYQWCGNESKCRKDLYVYTSDASDFKGLLKPASVRSGKVTATRSPEGCALTKDVSQATLERQETVIVLALPLEGGRCSVQLITNATYVLEVNGVVLPLSNFALMDGNLNSAAPTQVKVLDAPDCQGIDELSDTGLDFEKYLNRAPKASL